MQIDKPTWLRNWLDKLNWDILTWQVYVGDAVEEGIDWLLYYVNWGLSKADDAFNYASLTWDTATSLYNELSNTITLEVIKLTNQISQVWDNMRGWGEAIMQDLRDWADASLHSLSVGVSHVEGLVGMLQATWDTFTHVTLPNLISFEWWANFWQGTYGTIEEWWSIKRSDITTEVDIKLEPINKEVYQHKSWLDMIKLLFTDPEEFVTDLLAKIW